MLEAALHLTRSKRLTRALKLRAAEQAIAKGQAAFEAPNIQTVSTYLESIWQQLGVFEDAGQLLSVNQARTAWRKVVGSLANSATDPALIDSLYDAYRLSCEWSISTRELETSAASGDQRVFAAFAQAYENRQIAEGWLDPGLLATELVDWTGEFAVPETVALHGFLQPTPAERALASWLEHRGAVVTYVTSDAPGKCAQMTCFESTEAEALAAGAWARSQLEDKRDSRVAIVCLYAEAERRRLADRVLDSLQPGWQVSKNPSALDVAVAPTLGSYTLAQAAVDSLCALTQPMEFKTLSGLLRNPLITGPDSAALASAELAARREPEHLWRVSDLANWWRRKTSNNNLPGTFGRLCQIETELRDFREMNTAVHWAGEIERLLSTLIPGLDCDLGSDAWQLVQALKASINEIASIGVVAGRISGREALTSWRRLVHRTRFQPEGTSTAVELLGPYDVIGGRYDSLWVMGLDALHWPQRGTSSPYLSAALQRAKQMPGANPRADLDFAEELGRTIRSSAPTVRLSYATQMDGVPMRPASFGEEVPAEIPQESSQPVFAARQIRGSEVSHVTEPEVGEAAQREVSGGHRLLKLMHEQPFLAFCETRLTASKLEPPIVGVGAILRGILLHRSVERLYTPHIDTGALQSQHFERLRSQIADCIRDVYVTYPEYDSRLSFMLSLEAMRAERVLQSLVAFDEERQAFSPMHIEAPLEGAFGPLRLQLRLDRVDQVNSADWVIDFKTGRPKSNISQGDLKLPYELQLAVYACAHRAGGNAALGGMAIASLHSSDITYVSYALDDAQFLGKNGARFDTATIESWQSYFDHLASEFVAGSTVLTRALAGADRLPYAALFRPLGTDDSHD